MEYEYKEFTSVDGLKPYEKNPRYNDKAVDALVESIRQCGYGSPIVVDENMVILAGHTRYKALTKLYANGEGIPFEVKIIRGMTEKQKRKYRLLDNKTNELADWDLDLLVDELEGLDFGELDLDWGIISPDDFDDDFSLPDGEKSAFETISFSLATEQADLIRYAISQIGDDVKETFGNANKNGNAIYEVVRQWAALRT